MISTQLLLTMLHFLYRKRFATFTSTVKTLKAYSYRERKRRFEIESLLRISVYAYTGDWLG